MNNQTDVLAFGPLYLDFLVNPSRRPNLLYGRERVLNDYEISKDGFLLEDLYDDRTLQLSVSGNVIDGTARLRLDNEETECTYTTNVGGSTANFVVQLSHLGLSPFLIGAVGAGRYGNRLRELLKTTYNLLFEQVGWQTLGINVIDLETKETAMIVSGSSNRELRHQEINEALQTIHTAQFLYAGGFFKMRQLFPYYSEIFRKAQELGCNVVLDHGRFLGEPNSSEHQETLDVVKDALQHVDIYLPNETEVTELTGNDNLEYALRVAQELGPRFVVCKTGANGCSFVTSEDSKIHHVRQEHTGQILHTAGAGDSFNGGLIKGFKEGLDIESAARLGNATAYLRITRGTYPTYLEVSQLLT